MSDGQGLAQPPPPLGAAGTLRSTATGLTQPTLDRVWLAITGFTAAVLTWAFSGDRVMVHLLPDETGALAMARWMAGANRWNMFDHSTWQPALSVLIAPAYWFGDDPAWLVRWGLAANAVLAGAGAVVTVLLARRIGGLSTRTAALFAIAIAATPGALSGSGYLWAEPLIVVCFVSVTLAAIRTFDRADVRWAYSAPLTAAAGYFAHARLLPFVVTATATVAAIALAQRRARVAASVVAIGVAAFAVSRLATGFVHARVWDDPGRVNTSGSVFERLTEPLVVADHLVGQLWYQLVATLGIGAIGIVVVLRSLGGGDRPGVVDRATAVVITALTAPQIAVSAAFLAGRPRTDQLVYGRYNDAVMWPVLIVGLCWLTGCARRGWSRRETIDVAIAMVALAAAGAYVWVRHGDVLSGDIGLRAMVPGLLAHVGAADAVPVVRITLTVAAAVAVGAGIVSRAQPTPRLTALGAAACVALLLVGAVRTHIGEAIRLNGWQRLSGVIAVDDLVPADAPLAVKTVSERRNPSLPWERQRHRYQIFQLYLPDRSFVRDRGVDDDVGPYVFAPRDDPDLTAAGATVLWEDPTADLDLYLEPAAPEVDDR